MSHLHTYTQIQCLLLKPSPSVWSALVCIQVAWWFQIKIWAITPLIAIKQPFYCSSLYLHSHATVTTEPFSRECRWTQINTHNSVVLKYKKEPLFIQQLIVQIVGKDEPDPKPFHISLNFQHLVTEKVRTLLHVCVHTVLIYTKGEKIFHPPPDWHTFYFSKNFHWQKQVPKYLKSQPRYITRRKLSWSLLRKGAKNTTPSVLTCWITLTRSFSTCLRLRTSLFVITAVVRYLRICGHIVWIALRYLERKNTRFRTQGYAHVCWWP